MLLCRVYSLWQGLRLFRFIKRGQARSIAQTKSQRIIGIGIFANWTLLHRDLGFGNSDLGFGIL